jgi:hypothetical protein
VHFCRDPNPWVDSLKPPKNISRRIVIDHDKSTAIFGITCKSPEISADLEDSAVLKDAKYLSRYLSGSIVCPPSTVEAEWDGYLTPAFLSSLKCSCHGPSPHSSASLFFAVWRLVFTLFPHWGWSLFFSSLVPLRCRSESWWKPP